MLATKPRRRPLGTANGTRSLGGKIDMASELPGPQPSATSDRAPSLRVTLDQRAVPGALYDPMPDRPGWVHCYACGHLCRIPPGRDGICRVRSNRDGVLWVPSGYVGALQCDPVEKKPFFHALPGSDALSFGMLGCDYQSCGSTRCCRKRAFNSPMVVRRANRIRTRRSRIAAPLPPSSRYSLILMMAPSSR